MKKEFILLSILFLSGCNKSIVSTLNSISSSFDNSSFIHEDNSLTQENSSSENESSSFIEVKSSSNEETSLMQSSASKSSSSSISSSKVSSVKDDVLKDDNNMPIPTSKVSSWGQQEVIYDFTDSFPEEFSYVYGYQVLNNPSFYSAGGWKITVPNSNARMGFQTSLFDTDLKIEIRLYIGEINNSNNKVDKDSPFITIYGFNSKGKLIREIEIENQSNFYNYQNNKSPLNFYLNGEGLDYLEVRFTAAPYKGSQCYNFAIKQIGFKTFPYPL